MSDIFREVEEDVRRDRLAKFWKTNGDYLIALFAVILIGIAGFEVWQRYETQQREKDAVAFTAAQAITDPKAAATAFAKFSATASGGYGPLSKMEQANALLANGKTADAIALYRGVADSDKGALGAAARLRAAWAMADTTSRADLAKLLQPLMDPGSVWRQMAQEVLAYADYRTGNTMQAANEFDALAQDTTAPDALRNRARAFAAFLKNGGAANYGTVPPPAPPVAPATPPATP